MGGCLLCYVTLELAGSPIKKPVDPGRLGGWEGVISQEGRDGRIGPHRWGGLPLLPVEHRFRADF